MTSVDLPALLVVVGPTATGKSALAARLGAALAGEVVSADSVQVYRHFDVGSGKPSAEELASCPHHLIDIADPLEPMEASVWAERAESVISDIRARGRVPIVCGGTFLWVRALLFGLADAPPADPEVRARHREIAELEGREALHRRLAAVDSESAERLHPNDFVRVSRALEVFELSNTPLSALQKAHGFRAPRFRCELLSVDWERPAYEDRLRLRVEQMVRRGFRDEVRALIARGYLEARAMEAVGYRQVRDAVLAEAAGEAPMTDSALVESVVRVTRVFARRQRTWLRDEPVSAVDMRCLTEDEPFEALVERTFQFLRPS